MEINYKAGSYQLKELTLKNFRGDEMNIVKMFDYIDLYEDIFGNTISATVGITETVDLIQNFPIIGEESIKLKFTTLNLNTDVDVELHVFMVPSKISVRDGQFRYRLELCSEEYLKSKLMFVQNSFKNISPKTMINSILNQIDTTKTFVTDPIGNTISYIPNRMRPFEVITWAASRVIDKTNPNAASFLFFESFDGYNLFSLDRMVRDNPVATYRSLAKSKFDSSLKGEQVLYSINKMVVLQQAGQANSISTAAVGCTTGVFNPLDRSYHTQTQNNALERDYERFSHTSQGFSNRPSTSKNKLAENFHNARVNYVVAGQKDQTITTRQVQLSEVFNNQIVSVEVPGNSKLHVGQVLNLDIPSDSIADSKSCNPDRFMSGRYLVSALKHTLLPDKETGFTTTMELVRGTYNNDHEEKVDTLQKRIEVKR